MILLGAIFGIVAFIGLLCIMDLKRQNLKLETDLNEVMYQLTDLQIETNLLNFKEYERDVKENHSEIINQYMKYKGYSAYQIINIGLITFSKMGSYKDQEQITLSDVVDKVKEYKEICCKKKGKSK